MRNKNIILVALISLTSIFVGKAEKLQITVQLDKVITSSFMGNGFQWSAYPHADAPGAEWGMLMTDAKWEKVFSRISYMKPGLVRVLDQANWRYLKGFDERGNAILDFNSPEVKALEKLLGYCQKNNISVLLGEWGCPYKAHDLNARLGGVFAGANDPKWIAIIVRFLDYLINEKGYSCIRYYNFVNEPNGSWASTNGNWAEWSEGIRLFKKAIDKSDLSGKISIAGPDVVAHFDHPESQYTGIQWVEQSVKQLDNCIGLYDIHSYPNFGQVRDGNFGEFYGNITRIARETGKQIILGEVGFNRDTHENQLRVKEDKCASEDSQMSVYDFSYGIDMANVLIQAMNVGYCSAIAWSLDDAMHTNGDTGDKHQLKRWGFWNILGTELCNNPADENIRPWFYSWSLMCRYFPPGINIVTTTVPMKINGVRIVSGCGKDGVTVALVNFSNKERDICIDLSSKEIRKKFKQYVYSEKLRLLDNNGLPMPTRKVSANSGKLNIHIPANSFILLTSFDF